MLSRIHPNLNKSATFILEWREYIFKIWYFYLPRRSSYYLKVTDHQNMYWCLSLAAYMYNHSRLLMTVHIFYICMKWINGSKFGAHEHHCSQFLKYLKTVFLRSKKSSHFFHEYIHIFWIFMQSFVQCILSYWKKTNLWLRIELYIC
jgi:hypothetical protein